MCFQTFVNVWHSGHPYEPVVEARVLPEWGRLDPALGWATENESVHYNRVTGRFQQLWGREGGSGLLGQQVGETPSNSGPSGPSRTQVAPMRQGGSQHRRLQAAQWLPEGSISSSRTRPPRLVPDSPHQTSPKRSEQASLMAASGSPAPKPPTAAAQTAPASHTGQPPVPAPAMARARESLAPAAASAPALIVLNILV